MITVRQQARRAVVSDLHELRVWLTGAQLRDVRAYARFDGARSNRSVIETALRHGLRRLVNEMQACEREARKRQAREDALKVAATDRATVELVAEDTPDDPGEVADVDG